MVTKRMALENLGITIIEDNIIATIFIGIFWIIITGKLFGNNFADSTNAAFFFIVAVLTTLYIFSAT